MEDKIQGILEFIKFTHKFQQVKRRIFVTGEDRDENDAEHSFQLALLTWYLIDISKLKLNKLKAIKYALAHDLVETYAGDTYFYTKDKNIADNKIKREREAAEKISGDFKEFKNLHKIILDYELKKDKEAKFVYALDKILPAINVFLDQGRSWQRDSITYQMLRTKDQKVAVSEEVKTVWEIFIKVLDSNLHLFPK